MGRKLAFIVFTLFHLLGRISVCRADSKKICGRVTDIHHNGVPFCLVQAVNAPSFVYCNDSGEYCITVDDTVNKLIFYCVGYNKQEMRISGNNLNVTMAPVKRSLDQVTVTAAATRKRKIKTGTLGNRSMRLVLATGAQAGDERAVFLPADTAQHGLLKEVCYYFYETGDSDSRFRVHVYDMGVDSLPGNDLTDSNLVVYGANVTRGWYCVDISQLHIPTGNGVFVSFEWLEGYESYKIMTNSNEKIKWPQVIGIAPCDDQEEGCMWYGKEKQRGNDWGGSLDTREQLMIYATYTYSK